MGLRQLKIQARISTWSWRVNDLTCSRAQFCPQLLTHVSEISPAGRPAFQWSTLGQWLLRKSPCRHCWLLIQYLTSSPLLLQPWFLQGWRYSPMRHLPPGWSCDLAWAKWKSMRLKKGLSQWHVSFALHTSELAFFLKVRKQMFVGIGSES